jgi:hypothetical protein
LLELSFLIFFCLGSVSTGFYYKYLAFSAKLQAERLFEHSKTMDVVLRTWFFLYKKILALNLLQLYFERNSSREYIQANLDGKFLVSKADVGNRKML